MSDSDTTTQATATPDVSPDVFRDVLAFSCKFGHHVQPLPAIPPPEVVSLRVKLIVEEFVELLQGICQGNLTEIADGAADLMYVVIGTLWACGIDGRHIWRAVQNSNMAKSQEKRGDGKSLKPENWVPPDIAGILARQRPIPLDGPALAPAGGSATGTPGAAGAGGDSSNGSGSSGVDLLAWIDATGSSLDNIDSTDPTWRVIDSGHCPWRVTVPNGRGWKMFFGATPAAAVAEAMAARRGQDWEGNKDV